jgi:CRP-like cAMP-binding protein
LPRNAFIQLIRRLNMRAVLPGETVIREGEVGDAMYIVSNGRVKITKMSEAGTEIVLASLTDGAFFGEMALLSEAPRAASVVAEEETLLFELSRPMLAEITEIFPAVSQTMLRFYRQRLLTNLMATSPLFKPLNAEERRGLVEKFKSREVPAHEKLLVEGTPGDGLYMLLSGAAEVTKQTPMGPKVVAHLKEGDVFGEMSLLRNRPVSATVESLKKCIVLKLPRQAFMEVASTHPHVLEQIADISAEREKINDAILSGRLAFSSEGLIVL